MRISLSKAQAPTNLKEARSAFGRVGDKDGDLECLFLEAVMRAGVERLGGAVGGRAASLEWKSAMGRGDAGLVPA